MKSSEVCKSESIQMSTNNSKNTKKSRKRMKNISDTNGVDIKKIKVESPGKNEIVNNDDDNNNDNNNINEDNEEVQVKFTSKEADQMTGKFLRKSFNAEGGIDVLRKFIAICQESKEKDLVGEYLDAGGSILEILRLLDSADKKNLNNATVVFSAMYLIIIRILSKYPQYQPSGDQACRYVLNSHSSSIHSMMSNQSNTKQRKTILRLLTSMVTLGGNLPRELLNHLSFHSQMLEFLAQQTKPTDPESVRKCFIHFVLAFLVDGNVFTIKSLLEKRGLLSSIFSGLLYDSHTTVHLVLTTVKNYVLENNSIMKTLKLHIFSTPVVQSLVSLYNWKGPKNWTGMSKKHANVTGNVDPVEKEVATEAVHNFLVTLLTSNRYGIIFNDKSLGTSGRKHNQLVNTVLESLDRPWEHEKPCDLVIKVLSACPDLIKPQLIYTEAFLEPRLSSKWIAVMKFVYKIIESVNLDNLKPFIIDLNLSQLINASLTLTMPIIVLKTVIQPSINSASIILRQQAFSMLIAMLKQVKKILSIVNNNFNESDSCNYQSAIVNYIQKNMPSVKQILLVWNQALSTEESSESLNSDIINYLPEKIDHLTSIIELLESYRDISSELFNINLLDIENKPSEISLLTNLESIQTTSTNKLNEIKVKSIEINFQLNSIAFDPQDKVFSESFSFLISLIENNPFGTNKTLSKLDKQVKVTLNVLLKSLKIFQGCDDQIDIWINCFSYLENEQKNMVAKWFVKMVRRVVKNQDKYSEKEDGSSSVEAKKLPEIKTSVCFPVILSIALDHLKNHPNENGSIYISYVIVLTLHYQINPTTLNNLIENMQGLPNKYLSCWLQGTPVSLKKYFPHNIISNYSKVLLSKEIIKFDKIFSGNKTVNFDYEDQKIVFEHQLTVYEALSILQMTLFYLIQLIRCKQLHQELLDRLKITIITFLNIAKSLDEEQKDLNVVEKFSRMIFGNPAIFKYFSIIVNDNSYEILTNSLIEICKTAAVVNDKNTAEEILFLFKNKLFFELNALISSKKSNLSSCAVELVEIFSLKKEELVNLLGKIVNLPGDIFISEKKNLSSWGMILPKLIELSTLEEAPDGEKEKLNYTKIIQKAVRLLIELKTKRKIKLIETWEISLIEFLQKYPEYILIIDDKKFRGLLENNLTASTTVLIGLIISKHDKLIPALIECYKLNSKLHDKNIIFPIMSHNLTYQWTQEFLVDLFNKYNEEIIRYFTFSTDDNENTNWITNNISAISCLITSCFNEKICDRISHTILSSGDKLEAVDMNYIKLLRILYKKHEQFKNTTDATKELVQILIRIMVYSLKKTAKEEEKMHTLCEYLSEAVDNLKQSEENFLFEELRKNSSWPQFIRFSLKLGLKKLSNKNNQLIEEKLLNEDKTLPLLETVAKIVEVTYQDNSEDDYVKTIFEMTTSHSEFVNIMLSGENQVKKNMLQLLWVLIRKNNSLMLSTQIPLFLSAYNATLNESDQLILLILQYYEALGIKLSDYRPYLWGEAAANHYSIKGEIDTSLLRQPSTSQILELFNEDIIINTVTNFPINRNLKLIELHPPSNIYDPAFFLPLLISSLSVDNVISCHKIVRSGALALIFASCGSTCEEIRLAAFTVLSRFYFHLEATRNKNKLLWMRFIDALRNGVVSMEEQMEINSLKNIQLNHFITTFLAKASLVSARPINPLFVPIQSFLMAKPALDLQGIPEFLMLFHSSDINYKIYRHWILEVIRDGMKTDVDLKLAFKFSIFRMIFDFYHCILADSETKNLILQVLKSTTKITKGSLILIRDYGLLIWLKEMARKIEKYNLESVDLVLDIVKNLLNMFRLVKVNGDDLNHYKFIISSVLSSLNDHVPKKNTDVNNSLICKYFHCLNLINERSK